MFRLDQADGVARLTLDRPQARNAIPLAGWEALAARLGEVEAAVLVVAGTGGAFCAGADLGDFEALRAEAGAPARLRAGMRAALDRLRELPIPTVAWIDGACYGAGVAIAIACDVRVAAPGARFAITPARLGISYPQEDVHRLVALVGPGQAARLLLGGLAIGAEEALAIGLAELAAEAGDDFLEAAAANAPESLAALKRAVRLAAEGRRTDAEQDRRFDALFAGEALARRLEALGRK